MADRRGNNGGRRAGAGRKSKREEDDLQKLLKKCVTTKDREEILQKWKQDATSESAKVRIRSRESLWAYIYGRPLVRQELTGADGADLFPTVQVIIEPPTPSQAGSGPTESGD